MNRYPSGPCLRTWRFWRNRPTSEVFGWGWVSATIRNLWKVAGLKSAALAVPRRGFLPGWAPAVFPSFRWGWIRPGPTRLDKNSLGQPTCWGRIDDPLSFRAQCFLNRQVPSVFIPSLTSTFSIGCYRRPVDFSNRTFPIFLKNCKARSLECENDAIACD